MIKRTAFLSAGLLLLISPLFASADTLSDLQTQLAALMAQIARLTNQSMPTPPPGDDYPSPQTKSCPSLTVTMQRGSRDITTGGQVSALQIYLADYFDLNDDSIVTGYFGRLTEQYVIKFQQQNGLPAYGIVGSLTRAKIAQLCGSSSMPPLPPPPPDQFPGVSVSVSPYGTGGREFLAHVRVGQFTYYTWELDWGEGDYSQGTFRSRVTTVCNSQWTCSAPPDFTHTYPQGGLYTIGLYAVKVNDTGNKTRTLAATVQARASDTGPDKITVISPGSGTYPQGSQIGILWNDPTKLSSTSYYITLWPYPRKDIGTTIAGNGTREGSVFGLNYTWTIPYSVTSGQYVVTVCRLGEPVCSDSSVITVGSGSSGITVTAPNGGEQWEIGALNTVTWSPYNYNPDINPSKDVSVYLETPGGQRVGRVMDTGKASLHTYFNINDYQTWPNPGQYYVTAHNNVTGAEDRSDAPFTLLPRSVDVKVNDSDGPVTLYDNQPIGVSVNLQGDFSMCSLYGARFVQGGTVTNGSIAIARGMNRYQLYAYTSPGGGSTSISVNCQRSDGTYRSDSVLVNPLYPSSPANIQVISPNGGEVIDPTKPWDIKTRITGLKTLSIALYKNDQWYAWLAKDMPASGRPDNFDWIHSQSAITDTVPDLKYGSPAIFKIYATGQRNDGTGYVDDKSDSAFSFGPWQYPQIDIKANNSDGPLSVLQGSTISLSWTGRGNIWGCYLKEEISNSYPVYTESTSTFLPAPVNSNQRWSITCSTTQDSAPGGIVKDTVFVNVY